MKPLTMAAILAMALPAGNTYAQNLFGTWQGFVTLTCRLNNCDTQRVELLLNGATGSVKYPFTRCASTLIFENKTGDTYYYREDVVKGNCDDGAVVAVVPSATSVAWTRTTAKQCLTGNLPGKRRLLSCRQCMVFRENCVSQCADITHPGDKADCEKKCTDEYACIANRDCIAE